MDNNPISFNYQILGKHMRDARKKCRLTQAQIAELLGVSIHYYSSLERGTEWISFPRFMQFLAITKTSANELLSGCQEGILGALSPSPSWSKARLAMEKLLDQSSEEDIQIYFDVCSSLAPHLSKT